MGMFKVLHYAVEWLFPKNEETGTRGTAFRIANALFCLTAVLFFLYFFLVGLDLMGSAFKVLAGDSAGTLFKSVANPIAGLMVGILATVLVQSSSTTTSIIVAAVASEALPVTSAIPMIFGANIGTSVTNTIVSMGFAGEVKNYERAFSGATVHDLFNLINVTFWLPVELISSAINGGNGGVLFLLSEAIAKSFDPCEGDDCESWEGPLKTITAAVSKAILSVDKDVIKDFSVGRPEAELCPSLCNTVSKCVYKFHRKACSKFTTAVEATQCEYDEDGVVTKDSKKNKAAFIFCEKLADGAFAVNQTVLADAQAHYDAYKLNKGGIFYDAGMQRSAGGVSLVMSLLILIICLAGLVKVLNYVIKGSAERWVKRALDLHPVLAIIVGCGVTIFVQSSSITTSILTPLVAVGVLSLEKMYPLTLGANIGTTFTGILAALVGDSALGFQIALVHVFFNVFGVLLFYPIPFTRQIPLNGARALGRLAAAIRPFPIIYIIAVFLIYPGILLGISIGYEEGTAGGIAGSTIGIILLVVLHVGAYFWWARGGRERTLEWIKRRNLQYKDGEFKEDFEVNGDKPRRESDGSGTSVKLNDDTSADQVDLEVADDKSNQVVIS